MTEQVTVRLTATPLADLLTPELFACDLCCSVVTNPQQHFLWHQTLLVTQDGAALYEPFMTFPGRTNEHRTDVHIPGPELADLTDQHLTPEAKHAWDNREPLPEGPIIQTGKPE
jgi:hypothetical protein